MKGGKIMKEIKRTGKKVLSVFLAALMVMTAWVFVAPEAKAQSAGSYNITINYSVTDTTWELGNTYTGKSSFNTGSDKNNKAGFSLFYKTNNGTGSEYEIYWDIGKKNRPCGQASGSGATVNNATRHINSKGSGTATATIPGFPTRLFVAIDCATGGAGKYEIYSIVVNGTTIWGGTIHMESSYNQYYGELNSNYSWTGNSTGSYAKCNTTTRGWNFPAPTTVTWTPTNVSDMTCPKSDEATQTVKVTAKDQYGVNMYDPMWSVRGSSCGTTGIHMSTGNNRAETSIIKLTNAANISGTNDAQTGTVTATWGSGQTSSKTFVINDSTYTATFTGLKNTDATDKADVTQSYKHGHVPTSAETASEYDSGDYHYEHTGWSPELKAMTGDLKYTALYKSSKVYADLTELENQIANANHIKTTELWTTGSYTAETMAALESALSAAITMKNSAPGRTHQEAVDSVANNLRDTIAALKLKTYTVKFYNAEGLIIKTEEVIAGQAATAPESPEKNDDETYHYSFKAWDKAFNDITSNLDVRPTYDSQEHDWQASSTVPANCQHGAGIKKECAVCHRVLESFDDVLGEHNKSTHYAVSKEATCTEAGTGYYYCTVCGINMGDVTIQAKGHTYDTGSVTKDATCTETGIRVHTCSACGESYEETLEKIPHTYNKTSTVSATCEHSAYDVMTCSACGDSYNKYVGGIAPHDWKWTIVNATSAASGSVTGECNVCGYKFTKEVPYDGHNYDFENPTVNAPTCVDNGSVVIKCKDAGCSETITIALNATGIHNIETKYTAPSCTAEGSIVNTCSICKTSKKVESIPALGHNYSEAVVTAATCIKEGKMTYTCDRCGNIKETTIPKTGHKEYIVDAIEATCNTEGRTEGKKCAVCGEEILRSTPIAKKEHSFTGEVTTIKATCEAGGAILTKCANCDAWKIETTEKTGHDYESSVVAPTCVSKGYTKHTCKNCGKVYTDNETAKLEHNYELKSELSLAPSCEGEGVNIFVCADCGSSKSEKVNATGHSFGEWAEYIPATCTNKGVKIKTCSVCGNIEKEDIPVLGHSYAEEYTIDIPATCTTAGEKSKHCTREGCNARSEVTVIDKLGHELTVTETEATCTVSGKKVEKCSRCDYEKTTVTSEALGHNFTIVTENIPSTCQKEGSMTFACSNKDCHETKVEKLPVNPDAHNMVVDDAHSQTATCTKAGYTAYKCANEGCTHVYKKWTSDPTAHTEKDEWTVKKAATCSSNGYEVLECKDCGIVMDSRTIEADPALHVWKTVEVKADHTKSGYSYEQCKTCGAMRNFKTEDLIKHKYTERVAYVPATPEANGSVTYKCVCGDEKTFVIPATGCKFKEDTDRYVAPTCVADGTKYYVCEIHKEACANNYTESVPALGHKAGDVELTPATCIAEGSAVVTCTRENCGAELSRVTINKLPHTFSETDKTVVESTCQTHGFVTYTCTTEGCDATLKEELSLAEHKYKKISSVAPTCLDSGYDVFKCENCDANYHQVTVSANGHSYKLVKEIPATCSTNGHVYYECKNCPADNKAKYDYVIPATGNHTYTETVTVDAKCETAGYTYIKCADCDSIKKDSVKSTDPLGHNYTVEMGNGVMKCSRCDKTIVAQKVITDESGVHSLIGTITKTPTCTEEGVMTYVCQNHKDCKQNHEDPIPVTDHYVTVDRIVKTEPLCKQDGSLVDGSLVVNCAHCGKEIQKTVLPASHKFKITDVKKPNCNKEGTITEVCDDCGYIRYTYIAIDPSAHNFNYSAPVMEIKATCETDGYTVYGCTHCDAQKIVMTSPKLAHRNTTVTTVSAKCESDGYIRTTCDDCKKILSEEKIPMTGHKNTRTVTVDATCTKAGSVTVVCADCNDVLSATVLDPTGHTWGEWKRIDGATCEKEGTEKRVCLKCGDFETRQVGKGQHVYEVYKVVAPTCESEGYTVHKCRVCGHTYNDNYVEKTAHRYDGSMVVIVEPTCHSTGLKAQKCVYCGKVDPDKTHYYEIKMLSHNYGDWTVLEEAKCDSNGLKQRTCINEGCPEGFEGHTETKVISKIGHNYGEWTVTKQATCIAEGERQRTCDRCGYVDKEATAKGEHKRVPDYPVEPTCTSYGLTGGNHCEVCGEVFVAQQVIPMKNHLDINGDGKCDGCGSPTYKPDSVDTCLCHKTGIASIFYKIARFFWKILKINQTCVCGAKHY